jgi:ParB-like chromosome segregation protein Spo0J
MLTLESIRRNPDNPRQISEERLAKLMKSVEEFPAMMALRPIVVDSTGLILGGNMRYEALKRLKMLDIPDEWVKVADELSDDEKRRFIIEDNVAFGEWDWDALANDWDDIELGEWGMDVPEVSEAKSETKELIEYKMVHVLLSIPVQDLSKLRDLLETARTIEGLEIEQSAN